MLPKFIEQYTGKLVNVDGHPDNGGQSVQLIVAWCQYLGLPYQWAIPFDWWDDSDETFAEHWRKVPRKADSITLPKPGDIVVFSDSLPGSDTCGHLTIFVEGKEGESEWTGFDANWGGRSAHLQSHNWSYVIGWFTPSNPAVYEARIPTPIAQAIEERPFDIEAVEPFMIILSRDNAPLYNLNDVSWNSFNTNYVSVGHAADTMEISAVAKHRLGGAFYLPDPRRAEGYREEDCIDADGPNDEPEEEEQQKKEFHIAPPLLAPNTADMVQVPRVVPKYQSMSDALVGRNPIGELNPGKYYVFKRLPNGMLNVNTVLGQNGIWVNPDTFTEDDWRHLDAYQKPRLFIARRAASIVDQEGKQKPRFIGAGQPIMIVGTFHGPDKHLYLAPEPTYKLGQWYGIREDTLRPFVPRPKPIVSTPVIVSPPLPDPVPISPYAKIQSLIQTYRQAVNTAKERTKR